MFKRFAIASAVVALTAATPAFAQDAGTFTGFYIGAIAGWDHGDVDGFDDDGVTFGVQGGYDFNTGGAVIGIEAELTDTSIEDAERDIYGGLRVGAEISPGTLLYAKAGYTNARACSGSGCNLDGIRAGAGLEHQLGSNVFVKAEYRYSNYEEDVQRHQVVGGVGVRF